MFAVQSNGTRWFVLLAAIVAGCGARGSDSAETGTPGAFDRNALLRSYTSRIVLPALSDFVAKASNLETATTAYEAAIEASSPAEAERASAQSAWRAAMDSWQVLEVLQIGRAGSSDMTMGGLGLRDEIYSWPVVTPCRVDQETVSGDFESSDFFVRELVNTRGLAAIEYLLFDPDQTNACASAVDINANGSWSALVAAGELPSRRSAYAARAASEVNRRAVELQNAWLPSGGDFAGNLTRAGQDGSIFESAQEAIDSIFAALFYLELQVKDRKLAIPAGLSPECSSTVCPELQESRLSESSKQNLLTNIRTAERVFLGSDAASVGFDDFLRSVGAGDLADEMIVDLEAAVAATEAIPGTLTSALTTDPQSVRDAYSDLKTFTDDLKSEFVTVLNLTIPQEGAGDND